MKHVVSFDPAAVRELEEAADFYDLERPGLGSEFLDAVDTTIERVVDHPRSSPVLLGETRKRVVARFPYSIMYWVDDERIVVTAIAHHRRRPRYWGNRT